ncbi:MarR family transcriptional regulator [Arthrobacter sp. HLT1-20]
MARAVLFQDAVAKWGGLNSTDLQCASLLMSRGPATPGELAELTGLTSGGAITTAIDRLEREGFVARLRDPNDRWNSYLETLSDEQLAFANELFARAAEVNRQEIELLRQSGERSPA